MSLCLGPAFPPQLLLCFLMSQVSIKLTEIGGEVSRKQLENGVYGIDVAPNLNTVSSDHVSSPHSLVPPVKAQVTKARIQFITLCFNLFLAGWNDGSTGPLLPRIQQVYRVGFTVVSLIFVLACVVSSRCHFGPKPMLTEPIFGPVPMNRVSSAAR